MILASLCELARREELLTNPDYEPKPVAWIIVVGDGGSLVNVIPTSGSEETSGKKSRPKSLQIPRRVGRSSAAVADFAVDKSEYVLGVEPDGKRSDSELRARQRLFTEQIRDALAAVRSPALAAALAFLESDAERHRAKDEITRLGYKSNDLFAFEYRGRFVHEIPAVQEYFTRTRRGATTGDTQCLVCGATAASVDKHPTLRIRGGSTSGVALVSFNSDAFESYGRSRNENAPVCRHCVDAYTTALNRLLDRSYPDPKHPGQTLSRRFVALSDDTTAVFWATEKATILDLLADFFDAPRVESVAALLESSHKGRPSGSASNRFYCLILSGGQGRALLRGMHMGTVAQVEDNMRAYFESLDVGFEGPLPLSRIMRGLVLQGKTQNLPPGLTSDLFLAIVCGRKFPETVLTRAVERCRTERKVIRERAAILRAYLIRNLRWEVNVGLDKENTRPGYRLGRLMAVLEKVQTEAQGGISRTIVGYGAASTRPATVFSRLIGLAQHYIPQCRRPVFFQKLLAEVLEGIAVFPPTLSLEEQGLFALGYYHQKQDFYKKHDGETAETESEKGEAV